MEIILRAVAEVCVQLLFDVLPWAVFRILSSASPPALMSRGDGGQCPPVSQSMHRDPHRGDGTPYVAGQCWRNKSLGFKKQGNPSKGWKCCSVGNGAVSWGTVGENKCSGAVILWRNSSWGFKSLPSLLCGLCWCPPLCVSWFKNPVVRSPVAGV